MFKLWINFIIKFDSKIFGLKQRLIATDNFFVTLWWGLLILLVELLQAIVCLPFYIFLTPRVLRKEGMGASEIKSFALKRQVSFLAIGLFIGFLTLKLTIGAYILSYFIPTHKTEAADYAWNFNSATGYIYDPIQIQITDGVALFKAVNSPTALTPSPSPVIEPSPIPSEIPVIIPSIIPTSVPSAEPVASVAPTSVPAPEASVAPAVQTPPAPPAEAPAPPPAEPAPAAPQTPLILRLISPVLAEGSSCEALLQPATSFTVGDLDHWTSFSESASKNGGQILYQLSDNDGATWKGWNGSSWVEGGSFVDSGTISSHIGNFSTSGKLLFKAKFISDCSYDMQLMGVTASYDPKTNSTPTPTPALEIPAASMIPSPSIVPSIQPSISPEASIIVNTQIKASTQPIQASASANVGVNVSASPGASAGVSGSVETNCLLEGIPILNNLCPSPSSSPDISTSAEISASPSTVGASGSVSTGCLLEDIPLLNNLCSQASPTPLPSILPQVSPIPNVEISTPEATLSSNLTQTVLTIHQPVTLIASSSANLNIGGTNQTITIPGSEGFNLPTNLSITGSFNQTILGQNIGLVTKVGSYDLGVNNNQLYFTLSKNGGGSETVTANLSGLNLPNLDLVTATYDGQSLKLYLNGALIAQTLSSFTPATSTNSVTVNPLSGEQLNANIQPFMLYDSTLTPEEIAQTYLLASSTPPSLTINSSSQNGGTVEINYTLQDAQRDIASLPSYQYSTTGQFSGEEHTLTLMQGSLTTGLTTSVDGETHSLNWNVSADLPNLNNQRVYIRIQPADTLDTGNYATSSLVIDTKNPEINITSSRQLTPSGNVEIIYTLADSNQSAAAPTLEVSINDGLTWLQALSVTHFGNTLTWDVNTDLPSLGRPVQIRLRATDNFGNVGLSPVANVTVDTQAPFGLASLQVTNTASTSATLVWTPVSVETNFKHYLIYYGTNQAAVDNLTSSSVVITSATTDTKVLNNLIPDTTYYVKILATDTLNQTSSLPSISFTTNANVSVNVQVSPSIAPLPSVIPSVEPSILPTTSPIAEVSPIPSPSVNCLFEGIPLLDNLCPPEIALPTATPLPEVSSLPLVSALPVVSSLPVISLPTIEPTASASISVGVSDSGNVNTNVNCIVGGIPLLDLLCPTLSAIVETPLPNPSITSELLSNELTTATNPGILNQVNEQINSLAGVDLNLTLVASGSANTTSLAAASSDNSSNTQTSQTSETIRTIELVNSATESQIIPAPTVSNISESLSQNNIRLTGTGIPNSQIILFLFSNQAVVYRTTVDDNGKWEFDHSQNLVSLEPGEHHLYTVTYNPGSNIKSKPSLVKAFVIKKDLRYTAGKLLDLPTTLITALLAFLAIFWLRSKKRKEETNGQEI